MIHRRTFVKRAALLLASIPVSQLIFSKLIIAAPKEEALPAGAKAIDGSTDAVAKAIGYVDDVSKIDFAKYPARKKKENQKQNCANCGLYTASNKTWGKCSMLTAGVVKANGWCGSWSKKV
jgi:hypothetical protein